MAALRKMIFGAAILLAAAIGLAALYLVLTAPKETHLLIPDGLYENQQSVLLAPNPELWAQLELVFQEDGLVKLSQLFSLGVFDVAPGTEIRIIGEENDLTEVEIIGIVRSRDEDKIGRRAWVGKEFVFEGQ